MRLALQSPLVAFLISTLLLTACGARARADESLYHVGVARIDVTPDHPIRLCGYAARKTESEGIEQRLGARSLALGGENGEPLSVLITVDNVGVPRFLVEDVAARLAKRTRLTREHFTLSSTHTHTGPCLARSIPNMFGEDLPADQVERIEKYTAQLAEKLEKVALEAIADRKPARLAWGEGKLSFAANRRTENGPVDHAMPLLRVTDPGGRLRAVWVNYACHCTTLGPETNKHCGDWAGYGADFLDAAHPGIVTLVSIGCGADANPKPRTGLEFARQHGQALADEAARLLKSDLRPLTGKLQCQFKQFDLPFGPPPTREEFEKRAKVQDYAGYHARKNLARLDRGEKLETHLPYSVQTWTFGDQLAMVFLPGEVVVDYSIRLKHDFDAKRLWVSAYTNDVPCYIPSRRILKEGGYEAEHAMIFYDHPTRFAPVVEDLIVRAVHDLLPDSFRTPEQKSEFPRPLSPDEALASFKLPPDLRIELVAAEPLVVDPVAIDWGADGRLWVAEMRDYPTGLSEDHRHGGGRIKYLEDTDADGRYDRATVFVDNVTLPTGILHWRSGVLYCAAPDIVYAEDTDADGKADVRRVLFSGFSPENTQAIVNSLMWGLDGWVHGANSIASKPIHVSSSGKTADIGGRDFRMKPDTGEFEPAAGHAQYGRVRDDFNNWFGNENSSWLFHFPFPDHYARRNASVPSPSPRVNVARDPVLDQIYPISRTLERFNDPGRANRVTAACSPEIYRADLLGSAYENNAFICETVHNVIRRLILKSDGLSFVATKPPQERESEFFASTDNWFRPAQVRTGPDGGLWIVDMYRFVIEEPRWISTERLAFLDIRAGEDRGRIYRVVPRDHETGRVVSFTGLDARGMAELLNSPVGPLRDIIHQELVHRGDSGCVNDLRRILRDSPIAGARLQALWVLTQLDQATMEDVQAGLTDADPNVRRNAVAASESLLSTFPEIVRQVQRLASDPDLSVRFQVALSLGCVDHQPVIGETLARVALRDVGNTWIRAAVLSAATHTADQILAHVVKAPAHSARDELIGHLIATAAAGGDQDTLQRIIAAVAPSGEPEPWQLNATGSILDARDRGGLNLDLAPLRPVFAAARAIIEAGDADAALQPAAIRLLGRDVDQHEEDMDRLASMLSPQSPAPIQTAAIAALGRLKHQKVPQIVLDHWSAASPSLRSSTLDVLLARPESTQALLSAVEEERLRPTEIDAAHRELLFKHADARVREQSAKLLASVRPPSRKDVLDRYKSAMTLTGNAASGAATFAKLCATCHAFRGVGHAVGPNVAALTDRSTPYLFTAILDPNAAVEAKFTSYLVEQTNGRSLSGIITEETASSLVVLQGNAVRDTILRTDVQNLQSSNLSLMPEGLEEGLTPQQLADLIAYTQSGPALLGSATAPQANHARKAFLAEGTSGLRKIISAHEVFQQPGWLGTLPLHFCRQTDGGRVVSWETAPAAVELKADAYHQFRLAAAMGYLSQPAGTFTLYLNDKPVLDFNVAINDQEWVSTDGKVRMHYMVMQNNTEDSTGVLVIEVCAELIKSGEPAVFKVVGSAAGSQRWFGVYDLHEEPAPQPPEDSPAAIAAILLNDTLPADQRQAAVQRHLGSAAEIVAAMTADLAPGSPEEYRRIPWIWRVSIGATKAGRFEQMKKLLELSLPQLDQPLLDWQCVVIGGAIINGLSLTDKWPDRELPRLLDGDTRLEKRWARTLELAAVMADNEKTPSGTRYDALRIIPLRPWETCGGQLRRYAMDANAELQQGAVSGLSDVRHPEAATVLLEVWPLLADVNRPFALDAMLRENGRITFLVEALASGRVKREELGTGREQLLLTRVSGKELERARQVLARE